MEQLSVLGCIAPHMAEVLPWFMPLLAVVTGAVFGSYLTCALYRSPKGLSLWRPQSYCPSCKKNLRPQDLVPLLSWLCFKGRCGQCQAPIPRRYLAVEGLSIIAALLALKVAEGGFSFVWFYGGAASFGAAGYFFIKYRRMAFKSVAFGLLCLGVYAAFQQPLFACGATFY